MSPPNHAAAEADDAAARVRDGEHDPIAEAVVADTVVLAGEHAGPHQGIDAVRIGAETAQQVVPTGWRVTDPIGGRDPATQPALLQIGDGRARRGVRPCRREPLAA